MRPILLVGILSNVFMILVEIQKPECYDLVNSYFAFAKAK
ncbi:hypothetical protein NMS_1072 [Nonlabens marinus S1-08]|uniref:Uncharacterized protein n=1 Tax=Nonlabens marinus S1-08 TaxID=1454201 RepID=W8VZS4_9FLAO|nr:hypothetical protein NMS_1072 [Nonlabens marinus S1-08]